VDGNEAVHGDMVVDALCRYRCPAGWPRAAGEPTDSGAIYYRRYFELADGVEHLDAPILNPRGDLGYMGLSHVPGRQSHVCSDCPRPERGPRAASPATRACVDGSLRGDHPAGIMTSAEYGTPITDVKPMGGLMNVDRTGNPGVAGIVAVGDAFCHTDPPLPTACRSRRRTRARRLKRPT
jgi:hypothetical protein